MMSERHPLLNLPIEEWKQELYKEYGIERPLLNLPIEEWKHPPVVLQRRDAVALESSY